MSAAILILGCGYAGEAVARRARALGRDVAVTTRSAERAERLRGLGFEVGEIGSGFEERVRPGTHVVVAFPPDGVTDARVAPALRGAHAITYLSSTAVYGDAVTKVDCTTPVAAVPDERARRRLAAEEAYRASGAVVLRCPAIYGADRGLHVRVRSGAHRIPGDGERRVSRIHADDLAEIVLATPRVRGETLVVGDLDPAPHIEVVRWICATYGVPLPPFVPLDHAPQTLRAGRAVDAAPALRRLGVTLKYPTYREGMAPSPIASECDRSSRKSY